MKPAKVCELTSVLAELIEAKVASTNRVDADDILALTIALKQVNSQLLMFATLEEALRREYDLSQPRTIAQIWRENLPDDYRERLISFWRDHHEGEAGEYPP